MWDFNPHAFINMQLPTHWPYGVKCLVVFEFSGKTRKTSRINKSMKRPQPTVAGWTRGLPLIANSVPQWPVDTGTRITYWGPLSEMLLIASSHTHTHRQAPEGCRQECVHYDVQVCFITINVLHSPWRRPKSLWASVSCFRCSVMEICQRKIKTQLDWYDVCHGWTLGLSCVGFGLNSLYFCKNCILLTS